jgi:shikimate dehydrogenase
VLALTSGLAPLIEAGAEVTLTRRAAVLGSPIGHSLSPVLHRAAYASLGLDWQYEALDVADGPSLARLLERCDAEGDWAGLSLTMPLKKLVLPLLDATTPTAEATGAVNTVVFERPDGGERAVATDRPRRVGHNTDVPGLAQAVREAGLTSVAAAVVLGGGATASSAVAAMSRLGAQRVTVVVRSPQRAADVVRTGEHMGVPVDLVTWGDAAGAGPTSPALIISTVPAQGAAQVATLLAGFDARGCLLVDVAYDPWPTPVAEAWQRQDGEALGGFPMLLHQAVEQVRLMTGRTPDVDAMRTAGQVALAQRRH